MVKIIADSCSDLSPELIDKYHVDIIPLDVLIGGTNYLDGVTITTPRLFQLVSETGELPKTAAPSIDSFMQHFNTSDEVIYISISSRLSASYSNAHLAKESLGKSDIHIIDSLNLSTGIGLLVLTAAELALQGARAVDIVDMIERMIPSVRTSFVIDTLDYIFKGGRCTAIEMVVGSLLKIRPVIAVRSDGTLGIQKKINGSRKKALDSMIMEFACNLNVIDTRRIFITHTLCLEDALYLRGQLATITQIDETLITVAGSTIASHCGPNTIGILYLEKTEA
ncbi:MAG TPA: DegV family protein [Anaerolineaceae bacterium]|nr:DegV family protein [Anaerolineaceae bacterium]